MDTTSTRSPLLPFADAQAEWSRQHRLFGGRNLPCADLDGVLTRRGQIIEGIWMEYDHAIPVALLDLHDDSPDRFARRAAMTRLADRAGIPAFTIAMLPDANNALWTYKLIARNDSALKWTTDDGSKEMSEAQLTAFLYAIRDRQPDTDSEGVAAERNDLWRDEHLGAMFRALESSIKATGPTCTGEVGDNVAAILEAKKFPAHVENCASTRATRHVAAVTGAAFVALEYKFREGFAGDEFSRPIRKEWDFFVGSRPIVTRQMAARLAGMLTAAEDIRCSEDVTPIRL